MPSAPAPAAPPRRPRLLLLLPFLGGAPAAAQIPVTDAAHIAVNTYWHYIHYLQFALQVVHQIEQIQNQVRQIDAQLRALQKLRDPNWRQISGLLSELDYLVRSGRSLGYTLATLAPSSARPIPAGPAGRTRPSRRSRPSAPRHLPRGLPPPSPARPRPWPPASRTWPSSATR